MAPSTNEKKVIYASILVTVAILFIIGIVAFCIVFFLPKPSSNTTQNDTGCYSGNGPTSGQTAAFRATNHFCDTIWLEARAGACSSPLPGYNTTLFKISPGESVDINIPNTGLAATRFWAKWGCDSSGTNCQMGDQVPTWPNTDTCPEPYGCGFDSCPSGGTCPSSGCTPPIDTLFEATWGCNTDSADCNYNTSDCTGGCQYRGCPNGSCTPLTNVTNFDISQVDGWTLPYRLYVKGNSEDLAQCNGGQGAKNIDAIALSLDRCPTNENLTNNGQQTTVTDNDYDPAVIYSTESVNLQFQNQNQIFGCYSPCQKLANGGSFGFGQDVTTLPTSMYCCPTPPITSQVCQEGPVVDTQYVQNVHSMAPGVYAYAYDDGIGLQSCPAVSVIYEIEFGGQGSTSYPIAVS